MKATWGEVAALVMVAVFLAGAGGAALPLETTRAAFLEKCSRCHEPERGYTVIADRIGWTRTVASMAIRERRWIPPAAVKEILAYRSYYGLHQRTVFQKYCGDCHNREELEALHKSPSQWRTCVTYMVSRSGGAITGEETALLVSGL